MLIYKEAAMKLTASNEQRNVKRPIDTLAFLGSLFKILSLEFKSNSKPISIIFLFKIVENQRPISSWLCVFVIENMVVGM